MCVGLGKGCKLYSAEEDYNDDDEIKACTQTTPTTISYRLNIFSMFSYSVRWRILISSNLSTTIQESIQFIRKAVIVASCLL